MVIKNFSGGQKRRLSIGVALISQPSLIMLDEPTAGIDPKTRRSIWNLLLAVRQQNIAILLTSHSMDECEVLCSKIGFMNKGSLISCGSSQYLKNRYFFLYFIKLFYKIFFSFGNSYILTFTVVNPSESVIKYMNELIIKEFNVRITFFYHFFVLLGSINRRFCFNDHLSLGNSQD